MYTFFVYGALIFVYQVIDRVNSDPCNVHVDSVVFVKDCEDTVELDIMNVLSRVDGRLIVVDKGSTDDTLKILKKMEEMNPNMMVATVGDSLILGD